MKKGGIKEVGERKEGGGRKEERGSYSRNLIGFKKMGIQLTKQEGALARDFLPEALR